jgi:protein subunit release factor A
MTINPTLFYIIIGILVALLVISSYIIRNLLVKTEQYEDVTQDQVKYLQNISNIIGESKQHLQNLDDKGVFQSDDEVGEFFNQMKEVQEQLNNYMLPKNYGEKTSES